MLWLSSRCLAIVENDNFVDTEDCTSSSDLPSQERLLVVSLRTVHASVLHVNMAVLSCSLSNDAARDSHTQRPRSAFGWLEDSRWLGRVLACCSSSRPIELLFLQVVSGSTVYSSLSLRTLAVRDMFVQQYQVVHRSGSLLMHVGTFFPTATSNGYFILPKLLETKPYPRQALRPSLRL